MLAIYIEQLHYFACSAFIWAAATFGKVLLGSAGDARSDRSYRACPSRRVQNTPIDNLWKICEAHKHREILNCAYAAFEFFLFRMYLLKCVCILYISRIFIWYRVNVCVLMVAYLFSLTRANICQTIKSIYMAWASACRRIIVCCEWEYIADPIFFITNIFEKIKS